MPEAQFGSGSAFDTYRSQLSVWLRDHMEEVSPLLPATLADYDHKGIVSGWWAKARYSDWSLYILLDESFPFSHINIAYVGKCRYLHWPHVEEKGYLCLPVLGWRPIEDLASSIQERINLALELLDDCHCEAYIKRESAKEFLTYWYRAGTGRILSLIDLNRTDTRLAAGLNIDRHWLIGENEEDLTRWAKHHGNATPKRSLQTIFGYIDKPPALPLPKNSKQFMSQCLEQCPDLHKVIGRLSPSKETFVVLAVRGSEGTGLIGARLSSTPKNGFRKSPRNNSGRSISYRKIMAVWRSSCNLDLVRVTRADSSWIHGRGQDPNLPILAQSRVVVLGTGSLGSQVASRLAQAGVGVITLIDPQELATNNVGRHALGVDSVRKSKAERLAETLRSKYPHSVFSGFKASWQEILQKKPDLFKAADLFVSCIAETEHDLAWDSWYLSGGVGAPTVYGWLGTQGTTGHALALTPDAPGLSCFFDPDGFVRQPDTEFQGDAQIRVEPGCGTEFQPYGPLAVGQVELLVTRLSIDVLSGKISAPHHRIYACSTNDLEEVGGQWTAEHHKYRPDGYGGPFEYAPSISHCGVCYQCQT